MAFIVVATLVLLGVLVAVQVFVTRRTRRALNLGLAAATLAVLVTAIVMLSGLGSERAAVVRGGEHGYASVARLTAARVLAFEAEGDESAALIARGNGQSYESDLDGSVARAKALLDQATAAATGADLSGLGPALAGWESVDANIRALDSGGHHDQAVALARRACRWGLPACLRHLRRQARCRDHRSAGVLPVRDVQGPQGSRPARGRRGDRCRAGRRGHPGRHPAPSQRIPVRRLPALALVVALGASACAGRAAR